MRSIKKLWSLQTWSSPLHYPSVESKFSLESEGAAGRPLSTVAGERLEGCWEQMGAMALFVFVGLFMCFSQLDLR